MKTNDSRYIETYNNIREALMNGNNNVVAEMLDCSRGRGFLVEMNSDDRQYYTKIRIDADMEFVLMEIHPNITVGEPYKHMFSQYAMKKSCEKKVGNIRIGAGNAAEIRVEISFANGPVTVEIYERMEKVAMQFTISVEDELDVVAHGIIPEKNDSAQRAFERLLTEMHDESGEKATNPVGSEKEGSTPFSDFFSFLASHDSSKSDEGNEENVIDVVSEGSEEVV